jgi:hypothetical protein
MVPPVWLLLALTLTPLFAAVTGSSISGALSRCTRAASALPVDVNGFVELEAPASAVGAATRKVSVRVYSGVEDWNFTMESPATMARRGTKTYHRREQARKML